MVLQEILKGHFSCFVVLLYLIRIICVHLIPSSFYIVAPISWSKRGSFLYLISKTWKRRDFSSVHSRFQFSRRACPVRRRLSLDQTDNYGVMITRRFKRCKKSLDNQLWSEGDLKDIKREIMNFSESRSKNSMQSQNIGRNLASASSIQRKKLIFWQIISKILDADLKIIERLIICSKTFDSIGLLQESFSGLGSLQVVII